MNIVDNAPKSEILGLSFSKIFPVVNIVITEAKLSLKINFSWSVWTFFIH
jgi:hypothetical protein